MVATASSLRIESWTGGITWAISYVSPGDKYIAALGFGVDQGGYGLRDVVGQY